MPMPARQVFSKRLIRFSKMQKKNSLLLFVLFVLVLNSYAQSTVIGFGATYGNHTRPELDNYISYFLKAVDLPDFTIPNTYGADFYIGTKNKHTEYMFGAAYSMGSNGSISADGSRVVKFSQSIFDLHMGFDRYLTSWFFVGAQFTVSSFSGKNKYKNTGIPTASDSLIDFTDDSWNIFQGFSVGIRGESGFFIPFNDEGSGLKLLGYYDLGLSKYDFYNSFDKVLTSYPGDKKTKGNTIGVQLLYLFSISRN